MPINSTTGHPDIVEVFKGEGAQPWYWRLRYGSPGKRKAAVSEGYSTRPGARRAALAIVKRNPTLQFHERETKS